MSPETWINPRTGETENINLEKLGEAEVDTIVARSKQAFMWLRSADLGTRAKALEVLAAALEANQEELVEIADRESALGTPRLVGELARTAFQLRMFASALSEGTILQPEHDEAVDGPPPAGRPDLLRTYQPLGPVAVFGASNFPFAFSVLGGDTASALAAGCSVVVKEHSAQPRLGALTVQVAQTALAEAGLNPDVLLSVRGTSAGAQLVAADEITAVGFTGSVSGGRFLFNIATSRPRPIPFYGELGSVNPVVVTQDAADAQGNAIAEGFVESMLLGAGQFCTKPSVLLYPRSSEISERVTDLLSSAEPVALLSTRIAKAFSERVSEMSSAPSKVLAGAQEADREGAWVYPTVFETTLQEMSKPDSPLREECFGPSAVLVSYDCVEELLEYLDAEDGFLVGCLHAEKADSQAAAIADALALRAGRVVWNGWPTGVAVTRVQMHGGPYPAATFANVTSVGLHAVMRFVRPVVLQSFPEALPGQMIGGLR